MDIFIDNKRCARKRISLFAQAVMLIVTPIVQTISMSIRSTFQRHDLVMLPFVIMATLTASTPLPFIFRLRGEGANCLLCNDRVCCAASVIAAQLVKAPLLAAPNALLPAA